MARRRRHLQLARRLASHPHLEGPAAEQYLAAGPDETAGPDGVAAPDGMDVAERLRVAGLFRTAAAYSRLINRVQSERFLDAALRLLAAPAGAPEDPSMAAFISQLLIEHHAALFDLVRLDEADAVFSEIERRVPGPVERAPAVAVQIFSLSHRLFMREAIDLGMSLRAELGFGPPTTDALPRAVADGLDLLDRWVAAGPQPGELDRPEPVDPRFSAAALLLHRLAPTAYMSRSPYTVWLALQAHRLWVEEGPNARLAASLGLLPVLGITLRQDYRLGYQAIRRILLVSQARHYDQATSMLRFALVSFGRPWFEPVEELIEQSREAREGLLRNGEWLFASFTHIAVLCQRIVLGLGALSWDEEF